MKQLITLLALTIVGTTYSQNFHEGAYVYEGTSFRFVVPNDYEAMPTFDDEFIAYVTDLNGMMEGRISDLLMIGQTADAAGITNEELINNYEELELNILREVEAAEISVFTNRSGRQFLTAAGKVDDFEEDLSNVHFGMTVFGEVLVMVAFVDVADGHDYDKSLLEAVLQSYTEYETDRENTFFPYEEEYNEMYEDEAFGFENSLYETNLSYDNIGFFPEFDEDVESDWFWDEDWSDEYLELLLAYGYYNINDDEDSKPICGAKVFSGGYTDNYKSDLNKLVALQTVFPTHHIEGISAKGTLSGEMFEFKSYNVNSGAFEFSKQQVYTTEVHGELVFILCYFIDEPTEALEAQMKLLVKTFDYLD